MRKEFLMGTMLLLPLAAAAADFTRLAIKPGLWESTVTMKTGSRWPAFRPSSARRWKPPWRTCRPRGVRRWRP